jgi:hypothetical protein
VAINYLKSKDRAEELVAKIEKDYGVKGLIIQGVSLAFSFLLIHNISGIVDGKEKKGLWTGGMAGG